MRSHFYKLLIILPVIIGCSKKSDTKNSVPTFNQHSPVASKVVQLVDITKLAAEGKVLVESADCLSCHNIKVKMIGPSYSEVAGKYTEKDIDYLTSKIIEGGSGVWGDVPMAAHNGLSKENSKKMVYYILSQKK